MSSSLILATIFLSGCSYPVNPDNGVLVIWHKVTNPQEVCSKIEGRSILLTKKIKGCARWQENKCEIWAQDFKKEHERDLMATLGHELKHCFDRRWHE